MRALGVLLPTPGPKTEGLKSKLVNGKQQWCYLCAKAHDFHDYEEAY